MCGGTVWFRNRSTIFWVWVYIPFVGNWFMKKKKQRRRNIFISTLNWVCDNYLHKERNGFDYKLVISMKTLIFIQSIHTFACLLDFCFLFLTFGKPNRQQFNNSPKKKLLTKINLKWSILSTLILIGRRRTNETEPLRRFNHWNLNAH